MQGPGRSGGRCDLRRGKGRRRCLKCAPIAKVRRGPAGRGTARRLHLLVRMHLLRRMRRGAGRPLPQLRRRADGPADPGEGAAREVPAIDRAEVQGLMPPSPHPLHCRVRFSSGGAGIQADIKTITMLGGYAMTAITAITAQNTLGVTAVKCSGELVGAQIDACVSDIGVDAVKIGMLGSPAIAAVVAKRLEALLRAGGVRSGDDRHQRRGAGRRGDHRRFRAADEAGCADHPQRPRTGSPGRA
jgi:hypothetical protein